MFGDAVLMGTCVAAAVLASFPAPHSGFNRAGPRGRKGGGQENHRLLRHLGYLSASVFRLHFLNNDAPRPSADYTPHTVTH